MELQNILIVVIGLIAFGIAAYKVCRWFSAPDPCSDCNGCTLKQDIRQNKQKNRKLGSAGKRTCGATVKIGSAVILLSSSLGGCIGEAPQPSAVNQWIYNEMQREYLYYEDIPDKNSLNFSAAPDVFFKKLLSSREIRNSGTYLSTIEENKPSATRSFDDASDWYGFDIQLWEICRGDIVASVLYCQKDSPGYRSGIRRGDFLYSIDSVKLTSNSYSLLRSGRSKKIGRYSMIGNDLYPRDEITLQASEPVHKVPLLMDSLITIGSKRVGYMVYNSFATGPAGFVDKSYEVELLNRLAEFKSQGVDELVLDLRYNGGGYVEECAVLASCLVNSNQLGKLFAYTLTNNKVNQRSNKNFASTSTVGNSNLNLKRLFVLTSRRTASASELLINGLKPFCEIVQIGNRTEGKNIGSYAIKDSRYNWTFYPITLNIYNSRGENDYAKGYMPDVDNLIPETLHLYPFGDHRDPLLSKALEIVSPATQLSRSFSPISEEKIVPLPLDNPIEQPTWMIEGDRQ